jgi:ATP-dependent Lon protease
VRHPPKIDAPPGLRLRVEKQMKFNKRSRMPRKEKKDSGDAETKKAPARKGFMKRRMASHDDDDSVDSRGNVRNLIVSDEDDLESTDSTYEIDSNDKPKKVSKKSAPASSHKRHSRRAEVESEEEEEEPRRRRGVHRRSARGRVVESEEEEESEEEPRPRRRRGRVVESESEEEEEESEEEEDDEEYESEEEEEEEEAGGGGISILFGTNEFEDRMKPKRHNMKKESDSVKKFVKLVSEPMQENTIDDHIDQFKSLTEDKQRQMLETLERRPNPETKQSLMFKILNMKLPVETQAMILAKYNTLQQMDPSTGDYFKMRSWLEKVTSLPFGQYKEFPVKISDGQEACGVFMDRGQKCLNDAIFGQEESKLQILQFMASKVANPDARGTCLLLIGPPGIGKTSLIKNGIARALNWPFQFISLGGDSDASNYTGHQLVYEGSHCGKIVNSLVNSKSMSMILMFDEVDKISTTEKGQEIQNLLVHLTDPVQNGEFEDRYLANVPIDLSKVMFVFSANDISRIDRVLLDRMIVVDLKGYAAKEKLSIAENFLVPTALKELNLCEKVSLGKEVLESIISDYASEEKGVRELKRCIEQIAQKVNMLRMFNTKDLPFHIANFQLPFTVKKEHLSLFLKKKEKDESHLHLYT